MSKCVKRNPDRYESGSSQNHEILAKTLLPILEKLKWEKNEVILDHGCNSGKKALEFLVPTVEKYDGTLYALDSCESMIEFAKKNYPHPKVNYIVGDLNLPEGTLDDLKFNKIFSLHGIYNAPNYRGAIKSMYERLVPGGVAFLMIPTNSHVFALNTRIHEDDYWKTHHDQEEQISWSAPEYVGEGGEDKLKEAFNDAGFEIQEFEVVDKTYTFENPRKIVDYFLSLNSFAAHLTPELHEELENLYLKYYLETPTKTFTPGPNSENEEYVFPFVCAHILVKRPE